MVANPVLSARTYLGLLLVALATLSYEILLTRIFSVTSMYHFAFMAISIAMFGMTVGAILLYLLPGYFTEDRAREHLASSALLFAVTLVLSFLTQLVIPSVFHFSLTGLYAIAFKYLVIAVPFVFSGVCIALALTRFPARVSQLYTADLLGAALGCVLIVLALPLTDGPSTVLLVGTTAALGACLFASDAALPRLRRLAVLTTIALGLFAAGNAWLAHRQAPLIRLMWVKGRLESPPPLYEQWNSFSRVTVLGDPKTGRGPFRKPFGWGLSSACPEDFAVDQYMLLIDSMAGTPLTAFDGDLGKVEYLKYDVTNLVHFLRPDSDVFVIGAGGGRDVLSALVFGQKSVLAVELNDDIIETTNGRFGDFTGHLDRQPAVRFVADEARSYLAGSDEVHDIIQLSLIDTWAATAAGAFVLSESQLYTREAWNLFLERLSPRGVLSASRWYFEERPAEVYRLTSLAAASLADSGITQPRDHLVILRYMFPGQQWWVTETMPEGVGVGTLLASKAAFSADDLDRIEQLAEQMHFEVVLSPRESRDETFARIASGRDLEELFAAYPLDISPPTDNNPFFFQMLRPADLFRPQVWRQGPNTPNVIAVVTLAGLFVSVVVLTFFCILVPLMLTTRRDTLRGSAPLFLYFAAIGLGFMLVEVSQMQRMIVFLGHPTYGLSVLLFTLLVSSGLGSFFTRDLGGGRLLSAPFVRLASILAGLAAFALVAPPVMQAYEGASAMVRVLAAVGLLAPVGFFMGMAFPIGMKLASDRSPALRAWLWGINGATSVCAAVLAVVIALAAGIAAAYLTGAACYVLAALAYLLARRRARGTAFLHPVNSADPVAAAALDG